MKKLFLSLIIMYLGCSCVTAQSVYDDYAAPKSEQTKETKEEKKARKEREKQMKAVTDSADYKFATAALRKGMFALTATRVELGNMGMMECGLNESTNFVYQQGNEGVVQIAFDGPNPGYNGFGGITCKGRVTTSKFSTDKKGNAHYDFTVIGESISAQINITVYAGSKQAMAYVNPIYAGSNMSITLHGELVPYKQGE